MQFGVHFSLALAAALLFAVVGILLIRTQPRLA